MEYKKYKIIEIRENDKENGFEVNQVIEGVLFENAIFEDKRNFTADIISIKNSDYFIYADQVKELD